MKKVIVPGDVYKKVLQLTAKVELYDTNTRSVFKTLLRNNRIIIALVLIEMTALFINIFIHVSMHLQK